MNKKLNQQKHNWLLSRKKDFLFRNACLSFWDSFLIYHSNSWIIKVNLHQYRELLHTYLSRYWHDKNKGEMQYYIRKDAIRVNFQKPPLKYRVRRNDVISIKKKFLAPIFIQPILASRKCSILYEDKYCLIINKPINLVVQQNFDVNSPSVITDLFAQNKILLSPYLDMMSNVVHRLDKFVSGVLIVGRNYKNLNAFKQLFMKRRIYKEYIAVVSGIVRNQHSYISLPIRKDGKQFPSRMVVDKNYFRPAITEYEVISRGSSWTILRVILHTGKTHQIRVHLAAIGHPILGDLKYNPKYHNENNQRKTQINYRFKSRILLHARRINFLHPITGKLVDVTAPLPNEIVTYFNGKTL